MGQRNERLIEARGIRTQEAVARAVQRRCPGHNKVRTRSGEEPRPCQFGREQLSRLECGGRESISLEHIRLLCEEYDRSAVELGLMDESMVRVLTGQATLSGDSATESGNQLSEAKEKAVKRRIFMRTAGVASGALLSGAALESAQLAEHVRASDLRRTTLGDVHAQVEYFAHAFGYESYDVLEAELQDCRLEVRTLLEGQVSLSEKNALTVDLAKLNGMLGGVSFGRGRIQDARVHFTAMRVLAQETGHHELVAHAYATLGAVALSEEKPAEALQHAAAGRAYVSDPMLETRLACQVEGLAYAWLGDTEAATEAIRRAERAAERIPVGTDANRIFDFDPVHVSYYTSESYAWLGTEPERTMECAEQTLDVYQSRGIWPRSQLASRIVIGTAHAQLGEPVEASRIVTDVLKTAPHAGHYGAGIRRRIRALERAVSPYRDQPAVRELRELVTAWKRRELPAPSDG